MDISENIYTSRFIRTNDQFNNSFIFNLPLPSWWSRPYEYAWASEFIAQSDVVLDAASGVAHPLKFYLLDNCREVHACDIDSRILSPSEMLMEIARKFGEEAAETFPDRYIQDIHYSQSSISTLPYPDKYFDKIFCISVLEHLEDTFNRHPILWKVPFLRRFFQKDIFHSLKEFKRILKDDGLIILTCDYPGVNLNYCEKHISMLNRRLDYPGINLDYLINVLSALGLKFVGEISTKITPSALYSTRHKLFFFRAAIIKASQNVYSL